MNENIHKGHRERLRERFLQEGPDGFADHEILEMLLYGIIPRGDTNSTAHMLLHEFGSLSNLLEADPAEIMNTAGVGKGTAVFLSLIHEMLRRFQKEKLEQKATLTSSMRAAEYCYALLAHCMTERFYVICLDSKRRVIHTTKIADGSVVEAFVQPRMVMEAALRYRAAGVVLCHNHPGGNARPSFADLDLTASLRELLNMVGIQTVDHIIVAENNQYYSFSENGMLKDKK